MTMDIETIIVNNEHIPVAIGLYHPTFDLEYLTINQSSHFMDTAIVNLMHEKFHGFHIYLHNFARFDSAFLIPKLVKYGEVKPLRFARW